jgi:hypothetical protein
MTSTTLGADDLRQALRIIRSFTARDDMPGPESIHLEAGHGALVATATDKYVLGHMRCLAAADPLSALLIDRHMAKVICHALSAADAREAVHLRRIPTLHGEDLLEVCTTDQGLSIRVPTHDAASFPRWTPLFDYLAQAPAGLDTPIGLDPRLLRPFARAAKLLGSGTPRWHFAGPKSPVRVQIGDRFVGLIMPGKLSADTPEPPLVPVGLPA